MQQMVSQGTHIQPRFHLIMNGVYTSLNASWLRHNIFIQIFIPMTEWHYSMSNKRKNCVEFINEFVYENNIKKNSIGKMMEKIKILHELYD